LRRTSERSLPGYALVAAAGDIEPLSAALSAAGARAVPAASLEILRIEAGFPVFGRDISEQNLPQEVNRDDRAISFTKGCYLGQETVARIDALGHVNRLLCGLRFAERTVPPIGLQLEQTGQAVGRVTSAAWSPRLGAAIALGYLRRGAHEPGAKLGSSAGEATVEALPFWPR
jgi:folate-binding protein YgfZ